MDLDNIQRKYGLPAPLPVVQNGKFAPRFPLNLEHRGDDVFQFGGKYIGEIENIYDLLYKILTNQEIDASLALPYAIKITEDKLYVRDKTNSEWILIFDITKPNFPKEIELYELIYKAITHQVIGEDTSYPGQFKIEENILYVRDKDNLIWTQIGDVTKEFLGATEATQAILEQVNEILTEVQELKTELNRQIATTNETLTTALQAANEAMTSAQSINIRTFNSVEEMKASNTLKAGALVKTQGFYTADDGGGADYVVTDDIGEDEVDETSIIELNNNLYAKLLIKEFLNVKWFGAYGDNIHDDSECINKVFSFLEKTISNNKYENSYPVLFPKGEYKILHTVKLLYSCSTYLFNGSFINAEELEDDNAINFISVQGVEGELTHTINGMYLKGKNRGKIGILMGGETRDMHASTFRDCYIHGFEKGVYCNNPNTYLNHFYNTVFINNHYGFYFNNLSNSGEKISFVGCVFANNARGAYTSGNASDFYFINCSFDFNNVTYITQDGCPTCFFNCHIEYEDMTESQIQIAGGAYVNIYGGQILGQKSSPTSEERNNGFVKNDRSYGFGVTINGTLLHNIKYKYMVSKGSARIINCSSFFNGDDTVIPYKTPNFYQFASGQKDLPHFFRPNKDFSIQNGYVRFSKTNNLTVMFVFSAKNKEFFRGQYAIRVSRQITGNITAFTKVVRYLRNDVFEDVYTIGEGDITSGVNSKVGDFYVNDGIFYRNKPNEIEDSYDDTYYVVQGVTITGVPDDTVEIDFKDIKIDGY